jgi:uncharacterized membrane protein
MTPDYSLSPVTPPEKERLVVIAFPDETGAFALRDLLAEMEEDNVLEVGDAVVATRNSKGKVRLHQSLPLVSMGAALGSFGGMLLGLMILNPLFGTVAGAAVGASASYFRDAGIEDAFMKNLAETLTPGSSALFVNVRNTKPDMVLERLRPFAGRCEVLQTTMSAENEKRIRALLESEHPPGQSEATSN